MAQGQVLLYMSGMVGVVHVIDAKAPAFDDSALLAVADLGPLGETWSLSSLSYARGKLHARTSNAIISIAAK